MAVSPENQPPQALVAAPLDGVAARVTAIIRRLRPQVVVTFDPVGGYRHPDHIAIHQATVKAFYAAGDPAVYPGEDPPFQPQKLYYHTFPRKWLSWAGRLMPLFGKDPRRFGLNQDIDLLALTRDTLPVQARVDYRAVQSLKEEASACHASQGSMGTSSRPHQWAFRLATRAGQCMRRSPAP